MDRWKHFIDWCRRPDMIKIRRLNPSIGGKDIRTNPLQMGISIIMGWIILLASNFVIQSIIHPGGEEMFWGMLILGLGLIGLGLIEKGKTISTPIGSIDRKTLLQIGVVVAIIWVMILVNREGPLDLGLPRFYVTVGHTPNGIPIHYNIVVLMLIAGFPVLGLILLSLGIVLKRFGKL